MDVDAVLPSRCRFARAIAFQVPPGRWPRVAPPSVTRGSIASAPMSQASRMSGSAFMLPARPMAVDSSYRVGRGAVRGDVGYEHL